MTCSADGCRRAARYKNPAELCDTHYKRQQRGYSTAGPIRTYGAGFDSLVNRTESCWLWLGATPNGYGRFKAPGLTTPVLAHRYSYEHSVGPIPKGMQIDHLCRVRRCVRPDHLEPVTPAENLRRARKA